VLDPLKRMRGTQVKIKYRLTNGHTRHGIVDPTSNHKSLIETRTRKLEPFYYAQRIHYKGVELCMLKILCIVTH
jgi:hypothetical protein